MGDAAPAPEIHFTAVVQIAGINPYVDVPDEIVAALGVPERAPVLVRIDRTPAGKTLGEDEAKRLARIGRLAPDGSFRTTLVPLRRQPTRLYLDQFMRRFAGVVVGDTAGVTLRPDSRDRDLPLPLALGDALAADPELLLAWEALSPSRRREILTYLNFLKTPAALERNIARVIAGLRTGAA